jgi:hypothetical protein
MQAAIRIHLSATTSDRNSPVPDRGTDRASVCAATTRERPPTIESVETWPCAWMLILVVTRQKCQTERPSARVDHNERRRHQANEQSSGDLPELPIASTSFDAQRNHFFTFSSISTRRLMALERVDFMSYSASIASAVTSSNDKR